MLDQTIIQLEGFKRAYRNALATAEQLHSKDETYYVLRAIADDIYNSAVFLAERHNSGEYDSLVETLDMIKRLWLECDS